MLGRGSMSFAIVNYAIAPIMKEMNLHCSLEDEVLYGMKVEIIDNPEKDWFRIRTHYRYEGFMQRKYLIMEEEKISVFEHSHKSIVTNTFADVLSMPKYQGVNIISLTRGGQVGVHDHPDDNGWVKVQLVDCSVGYMKEKFLGKYEESIYRDRLYEWNQSKKGEQLKVSEFIHKVLNKSELEFRNDLVETAMKYLGTQYRWGGKSSLGIDCSGLCSMSYMLNGLIIYRDASIQEGFPIREISFEDKKPGDLLFFPGHVAMYMGDGKYIHATGKNGSDGVVINSLHPEDTDYREDLPKILTSTGSVF